MFGCWLAGIFQYPLVTLPLGTIGNIKALGQIRRETSPKLRFMRRFILSWLYKHNGAVAGLFGLCLIIGASLHAMHGQFEDAAACQTKSTVSQQSKQSYSPCNPTHQTPSFDLLGLFFSRS